MDRNLIEKYKAEMLKMRSTANIAEDIPKPQTSNTAPTMPQPQENNNSADSTGNLIAIVTTLRALYPLENARVTVFKGSIDDMQVVAEGITNQSGRSESFSLKTPSKELSLSSGAASEPFARYNMKVQAEGYLDNIHLNIPVFSGVTSIQASNMILLETAGVNNGPQIFDESQSYGLD